MNNNPGYTIERLAKHNLEDVAKLHLAVYGKPAAENFFVKKYDTAYTGMMYTGFIAYNNDRIAIGYYGVIPCFLQDGDEIILSAQSADTMTHPLHRYKGLFVELSNMTFDLCRAEGIKLIFGFPNQNSFHGAINKLGWQMTETMDFFQLPVKAVPLEKVAAKFTFLKSFYRKYTQSVLNKYVSRDINIINSVIRDGYAGVHRDADYMLYKSYYNRHIIEISGSTAWIKLHNGLIIGDMNIAPGNFDSAMSGIKKLAKKLGVSTVQFHCSPGTSMHILFSEKYKPVPSFPVLFQVLVPGILLERIKFSFGDMDIF